MTTSSPIQTLIDILTGQRDCYAALLRLAEQKHQAIVGDDLQSIEHSLEQEQALIGALGRLEGERLALAGKLADHLQLSIDQINITSLLERVDPFTRRVLTGLRDEIARDLQRAEEQNQINGELLKKALRRVNRSLQILRVDTPQSPTYGPVTSQSAKPDHQSKANLFDRKV